MTDHTGVTLYNGVPRTFGHHSDPVENTIARALDRACIPYTRGSESRLDFELLDGSGVYIECKRMFAPRILDQMQRRPRVIVVQSLEAAQWLADRLSSPLPRAIASMGSSG